MHMTSIAIVAGAVFATAACSSSAPKQHTTSQTRTAVAVTKHKAPAAADKDIVDVAAEAGNFQTLLAAAEAADLVPALRAEGPITVFAPTDEAFAKLPEGTIEALLEDKEALAAVLTYHVVAGDVRAEDVANLTSAETLQGGELDIDTSSGVRINDANVVTADIVASNGVIHVIDTVLIPQ